VTGNVNVPAPAWARPELELYDEVFMSCMPSIAMVLDSQRGTQSLWEWSGYGSNTVVTLQSGLQR